MSDFPCRLNELKCCVIIPAYNNADTIEEVVNDTLKFAVNIIIVNDGSNDGTSEILKKYPSIEVIHHIKNLGKGQALKNAFQKAIEKGFLYAITMDSDGQHKASDIPALTDAEERNPGSLIIGKRNLKQENLPGKNNFANKFSNFWFRFIAGQKLDDTQSGYRLYPLNFIKDIKPHTGKYEFELEMLVRAAWKGIKIISVPINVYYPPAGKRISHFRPFTDFMRISALNTVLFFIAVFYVKPRKLFKK